MTQFACASDRSQPIAKCSGLPFQQRSGRRCFLLLSRCRCLSCALRAATAHSGLSDVPDGSAHAATSAATAATRRHRRRICHRPSAAFLPQQQRPLNSPPSRSLFASSIDLLSSTNFMQSVTLEHTVHVLDEANRAQQHAAGIARLRIEVRQSAVADQMKKQCWSLRLDAMT